MTRTATLAFARSDEKDEVTLGQFTYGPSDSEPGMTPVSVLSASVALPGSGELVALESACAEVNGNSSFAIFCASQQILLVSCRWDEVSPHISVRVPGMDAWLRVYLEAR